jgi:hypothetical protein
MVRSILAIVAGLVTMMVAVFVLTWILVWIMFDDPMAPPTSGYLVINLLYSLAAAVAGGYVAATMAPRAPLGHAAALAAGIFTLGFLGVLRGGTAPGQPTWYPYVMTVLGPVGLVVGGWIRERRARTAGTA